MISNCKVLLLLNLKFPLEQLCPTRGPRASYGPVEVSTVVHVQFDNASLFQ